VLLLVMARLATLLPGNELAIPDMQGNRRTSSGCSLRIPDVASLPMRTGRPHDTHSQGYIVAAMLDRCQCRHDAVRVEKGWRNLNWPALIIFLAGIINYQ
jgi:hypothetical protein